METRESHDSTQEDGKRKTVSRTNSCGGQETFPPLLPPLPPRLIPSKSDVTRLTDSTVSNGGLQIDVTRLVVPTTLLSVDSSLADCLRYLWKKKFSTVTSQYLKRTPRSTRTLSPIINNRFNGGNNGGSRVISTFMPIQVEGGVTGVYNTVVKQCIDGSRPRVASLKFVLFSRRLLTKEKQTDFLLPSLHFVEV